MSSDRLTSSPGAKPGALDRPHQRFERFLVGRKRRPPAAFVGHALQEAALGHDGARGAVDLGRDRQRLSEGFRARRDHHEVLNVDSPSRMGAAAEDLDLGQRNDRRLVAETIAPERQAAARRRRMKQRQRNRGQRVPPEPRLVRRAVEGDESSRRSRPDRTGRGRRERARFLLRSLAARPARRSRRSAFRHRACRSPRGAPREAPAGAIPRPTAPSLRAISASTVGRPRESQMRRAIADRMTGSLIALCSRRRPRPSGDAADRRSAARRIGAPPRARSRG